MTTHFLIPQVVYNMKDDTFWKLKISEYCKSFGFFRKQFIAEVGIDDNDIIEQHWYHLIETTCDCEGCREDTDCTIHIACEDEDAYTE